MPIRSKSGVTRPMGHDIKTPKCERRKVSGFKHGNFPSNNIVMQGIERDKNIRAFPSNFYPLWFASHFFGSAIAIVFPEGEGQRILRGAEAITHSFQEFGLSGHLAQTLPQLVIVFLVVFFALVLQGFLLEKARRNA